MKNIPQHVAIIMDGNGRWAKSKNLLRTEGHRQGLSVAENVIDCSIKFGVKFISLFVFSTENWKRPKAEISALFSLAEKYLDGFERFCRDRVRVVVSGEKNGLPSKLVSKIEDITQKTANFDAICVNLCINYGGRQDIVQACNNASLQGKTISEQTISENLYNAFIPAPDIIIRTGGQKRLSNFMLFQGAYAELYFTDTLWPDFSEKEYAEILADYACRDRKFGGITE